MFNSWGTADYLQASQIILTILEIVVTTFVAVWVVRSVQRKLDNERILKDYLANELIDLRSELRAFIEKLISSDIKANSIKREHHLLSIRMKDLLDVMNKKFNIDKKYLKVYRQNLLKIVEEDASYQDYSQKDVMIALSQSTIDKLHDIRTKNDHLFNDILMKLYE